MGNCMKKELSVLEINKDFNCRKTMKLEEDDLLMGENNKENLHSSTTKIKEVKIKITKKQLSELMGKADIEGLSIHQLLTKLMNVDEDELHRHHSWRPALHTILEVGGFIDLFMLCIYRRFLGVGD
ncbi:hypothetical protein H5410_060000 [Solanum commersonii]|uniref:Uncharacterized protein n=1 Tax=Solanum commersonii TaxID=4109 RepID=A0A9J5W406_SOLCO|nr:hypothetical protein H5410_060000 [Solanum commersonii]